MSEDTLDRPTASTKHRGVNFGFFCPPDYYGSKAAREQIDLLLEHEVDWVCLIVNVMQETIGTTRQFRDFQFTPPEDELRAFIDYIHGRGLKVQLRPMLHTLDGGARMSIRFPPDGEMIPGMPLTHASQWFKSFTQRSVFYAKLATRAGCDAYGLDSELDFISTGQFSSYWRETIKAVRGVFTGHLTTNQLGVGCIIEELKKDKDRDHWWRELDSLGTSFYLPLAKESGATLAQMITQMEDYRNGLRELAEMLGKPFYLGEVGCCSTQGAAVMPHYWGHESRYDGEEQANYLEAVFSTLWDEPWFMGSYLWKWDEHNYRENFKNDPAGDKGFTVAGKPAAEIIKKWYAKP